MQEEFKTVAQAIDKISADIIAERLISAGIPAAVMGGSSPYPSLGFSSQLEVKVNAADYDRAVKLLAEEPLE